MENGSYLAVSFRFRRVTCINRFIRCPRGVRESYSTEVSRLRSCRIFKSMPSMVYVYVHRQLRNIMSDFRDTV